MENSFKDWPIILDEASYSHLCELSSNLSKVEGLVKKLVDGDYQKWYNKTYKLGQNFASTDIEFYGDWPYYSKTEKEKNNNESQTYDWESTNDGDASNDKNNNTKNEQFAGWNDNSGGFKVDWTEFLAEKETPFDLNKSAASDSDKAFWESGWEKSNPKESNIEELNWD